MPEWVNHMQKSMDYEKWVTTDYSTQTGEEHPAIGQTYAELHSKERGAKGLFEQHKAGK